MTGVCTRPPSQPFRTKWGDRIKAEFTLPDGTVEAVFADVGAGLERCFKGAHVELFQGKRGFEVGEILAPANDPRPPMAASTRPAQTSSREDAVKAQAERIRQEVRRMAFCFSEVSANSIFSPLSEESRRAIATSVFIQTANI